MAANDAWDEELADFIRRQEELRKKGVATRKIKRTLTLEPPAEDQPDDLNSEQEPG